MRSREIGARVTGPPLRVEVTLPIPDRSNVEELRQRMLDPGLTSNQQARWREAFRVAEVLYHKENAPGLAARAALPIVCELQREFLLTGDRGRLASVSLGTLATRTGFSVVEVAKGFRGVAVESPAGLMPVDKLLGPVGPAPTGIPIGYIDPALLIPTDHPRDPATYTGFVEIFREGRDSILDPVLAVEDPRTLPKGFVLQGHHRAAAAFTARRRVRVAILRTTEDLLEHVQEGTAAEYARGCRSFDEFLEICREQSRRLRLYEHGWPEWLAALV